MKANPMPIYPDSSLGRLAALRRPIGPRKRVLNDRRSPLFHERIIMQKPQFHIFLCNSFRVNGEPLGVCNKKKSADLLQYLQCEIADRGLDAIVSTTSCMNVCEKGPILLIYPQAWWYHEVTEAKIDEILDSLEAGEPADELLMA